MLNENGLKPNWVNMGVQASHSNGMKFVSFDDSKGDFVFRERSSGKCYIIKKASCFENSSSNSNLEYDLCIDLNSKWVNYLPTREEKRKEELESIDIASF